MSFFSNVLRVIISPPPVCFPNPIVAIYLIEKSEIQGEIQRMQSEIQNKVDAIGIAILQDDQDRQLPQSSAPK